MTWTGKWQGESPTASSLMPPPQRAAAAHQQGCVPHGLLPRSKARCYDSYGLEDDSGYDDGDEDYSGSVDYSGAYYGDRNYGDDCPDGFDKDEWDAYCEPTYRYAM